MWAPGNQVGPSVALRVGSCGLVLTSEVGLGILLGQGGDGAASEGGFFGSLPLSILEGLDGQHGSNLPRSHGDGPYDL